MKRFALLFGLASCPISVLFSTLIFQSVTPSIFWSLTLLATGWLTLEVAIGARTSLSSKFETPGWVRVTRIVWLCGPWVCWIDREFQLTIFPITTNAQLLFMTLGWIGLALRTTAVRQVGSLFTYGIEAPPDLSLQTKGVYRFVRHPSFTGLCLMTNLLGFVCGSGIGILLLASTIPNVLFRIRQEETDLLRRFGNQYAQYQERSYRLIPFVY